MKQLDTEAPPRSPAARTWISLALVIHLFFVFAAFAANHSRSLLQRRLLDRFAFYTRLLHLDPDFAPYHLTHAGEADVDHRIEVAWRGDGTEERWTVLPSGWKWSEDYKRQQRLARTLAFVAEDEALAGAMAQAVGSHFAQQTGEVPRQVRARRHLLQDWDVRHNGTAEERDPDNALYFRVPYAANLVQLGDGPLRVVRVEEAGQVALPGQSPPDSSP